MRGLLAVILLGCGLGGCTLGEKPAPLAAIASSTTEQTRAVAMPFLQRMFIDHDVRGAYDTYAAADFRQHNPQMADGLAGHRAYFESLARNPSGAPASWAHVSDLVLVDGDIFAFLHHRFRNEGDKGQVFVDLWRVADGRIVEHWDVIQDISASLPHGNGMACGIGESWASARANPDSVTQTACAPPSRQTTGVNSVATYRAYTDMVAKGDVLAAIDRWFHPAYRQHSPVIADGKQGAIDYLKREWGNPDTPLPELGPMRIVAEGDYVLVHYLYRLKGAPDEVHVDIFRITEGLVSEHWDYKQAVPQHTASGNPVF